ncbi:MAG: putative HMP/thiamine import ATP-binding protein YkoD [Calditrichaeota bacterium]|nr:putative HMP/thiamine import ATP-binding protein YkoD [Calditrichota bacterium]
MNDLSAQNRLLEFAGVGVSFAGRRVLRDVSFSVRRGELVVLAGRSGAGKTTVVRVAADLLRPERGTVRRSLPDERARGGAGVPRIGVVRQQPENQLVAGTVEEEVAFALALAGLPAGEIHDRVRDALAATGLTTLKQRAPHTLSGGMMQRLAVAAGAACRPELWLLDEPTAYLDPNARGEFYSLLRRLRRETAVLYVASNPDEWTLGDRLILLDEGRVVADDTPDRALASGAVERAGLVPPRMHLLRAALANRETSPASRARGEGSGHLPESGNVRPAPVPSAAPATSPFVRARALYVNRRDLLGPEQRVLSELDLTVAGGERIALVGPGGAGKTTLLEALAGLLPVAAGELDTCRCSVPADGGRSGIALAFQFPERSFFAETVREEVAYGLRNHGSSRDHAARGADEALRAVGLEPEAVSQRSPFTLSGGEARRVALACVLALRPRLLLLDEPTAGLDDHDADLVGEIIRAQSAAGAAVIASGHDLDRFADWCERWVLVDGGRVVHDGDPRRLWPDHGPDLWSAPATVRAWRESGRATSRMPGVSFAAVLGAVARGACDASADE